MQQTVSKTSGRQADEFLAISLESWVLVAICLADAFSTLILINLGLATEYNPMMDWCLKRGASLFLLVKALTFVPFVWVAESYRRRDPVRGRLLIRSAVGCYLVFYVVLIVLVNMRLI